MLLTTTLKHHYVEIVILRNKESFSVLVSCWLYFLRFGRTGWKPVLLFLFLCREVYSCSHTHRRLPSSPCWPLSPDVCHSRWWQSEMALPTRRRSSDNICLCPPAFPLFCVRLSSSVASAAYRYVTHWPTTWLVSDSHQSTFSFHNDSYRTKYHLDVFEILEIDKAAG